MDQMVSAKKTAPAPKSTPICNWITPMQFEVKFFDRMWQRLNNLATVTNYVCRNHSEALKLKNNVPAAKHGGGSIILWWIIDFNITSNQQLGSWNLDPVGLMISNMQTGFWLADTG